MKTSSAIGKNNNNNDNTQYDHSGPANCKQHIFVSHPKSALPPPTKTTGSILESNNGTADTSIDYSPWHYASVAH